MNEAYNVPPSATEQAEREPSLIDFMIVLAKHKKLIIGLPLVAVLLALAISFALPKVYRANTKLLPPQGQSSAASLLSQLGGVAGAFAASSGLKNPNEMYVGMLRSRTIGDKLIDQFKLEQVYDADSRELARRELQDNTFVNSGKDGLITIEVQGKDPKMTAGMANAYVAELTKLTKTLAVTDAGKRRLFFEKQLEMAKDNLARAEMSLKTALDTRGVISVDANSRAIVETIGQLRARVSAKEIELSSMSAFVTTANPEYRRTQEELSSLKAELSRLENGRPGQASGDQPVKSEGLENIKVLRDVKYYQMLYELLAKQYEVARLDEAKDPAIIQVLDEAVVPEKKYGPKRAIIVLLTGILAVLASIAYAFIAEARARASKAPENAERLAELKRYLSRNLKA